MRLVPDLEDFTRGDRRPRRAAWLASRPAPDV